LGATSIPNSVLELSFCVFFFSGEIQKVTYKEWGENIQQNFDEKFFISDNSTAPNIHKQNIYRDTVGSPHDYLDNQTN